MYGNLIDMQMLQILKLRDMLIDRLGSNEFALVFVDDVIREASMKYMGGITLMEKPWSSYIKHNLLKFDWNNWFKITHNTYISKVSQTRHLAFLYFLLNDSEEGNYNLEFLNYLFDESNAQETYEQTVYDFPHLIRLLKDNRAPWKQEEKLLPSKERIKITIGWDATVKKGGKNKMHKIPCRQKQTLKVREWILNNHMFDFKSLGMMRVLEPEGEYPTFGIDSKMPDTARIYVRKDEENIDLSQHYNRMNHISHKWQSGVYPYCNPYAEDIVPLYFPEGDWELDYNEWRERVESSNTPHVNGQCGATLKRKGKNGNCKCSKSVQGWTYCHLHIDKDKTSERYHNLKKNGDIYQRNEAEWFDPMIKAMIYRM